MKIARKAHESTQLILCPSCLSIKWGTRHHVFPVCWYGNKPPYLWLCDDCHRGLHNHLRAPGKLGKDDILQITAEFLRR